MTIRKPLFELNSHCAAQLSVCECLRGGLCVRPVHFDLLTISSLDIVVFVWEMRRICECCRRLFKAYTTTYVAASTLKRWGGRVAEETQEDRINRSKLCNICQFKTHTKQVVQRPFVMNTLWHIQRRQIYRNDRWTFLKRWVSCPFYEAQIKQGQILWLNCILAQILENVFSKLLRCYEKEKKLFKP